MQATKTTRSKHLQVSTRQEIMSPLKSFLCFCESGCANQKTYLQRYKLSWILKHQKTGLKGLSALSPICSFSLWNSSQVERLWRNSLWNALCMYIQNKMKTPKILKNNRDIRKVSNKQHQYCMSLAYTVRFKKILQKIH